jgi:hypothetical protein
MYKLIQSYGGFTAIEKDNGNGHRLVIPFNNQNTDYQAYLKWLAEGNLPIPPESTEGSANPDPLPADEPTK